MIKRKDGFLGERSLVLPAKVISELENDRLARVLHITDIGYYPNAKHHFRKRDITIPQYILIYCVEGKGWFKVNNKRTEVEANHCFVLPANKPHSYGSNPEYPWTIYWIHFKGELADYYASFLHEPIKLKPHSFSRINDRINLFEEIYRTFESGYKTENLRYTCSTFHHFMGSICYLDSFKSTSTEHSSNDLIDEVIHYMKENISKKLTISDLVEHTGYSSSYFSSTFSQRTGYSPINYFNLLKMQQACFLIDCTNIKVNQVCYKVGINDCYYFSRLFTKIIGISPSAYKKLKRG